MKSCPFGSVNLTSPNPMPEIDSSSLTENIGMFSVCWKLEKSFLSGEIDTLAPVSIIQEEELGAASCRATATLAKLGFGLVACRFVLNSGLLLGVDGAAVEADGGVWWPWPSFLGRCWMRMPFSTSLFLE